MKNVNRGRTMTKSNGKTFVKITNKDIFNTINEMREGQEELKQSIENLKQKFTDFYSDTNKDSNHKDKIIYGSYGFTLAVLAWLISHILIK